jgi:hypothetical protein
MLVSKSLFPFAFSGWVGLDSDDVWACNSSRTSRKLPSYFPVLIGSVRGLVCMGFILVSFENFTKIAKLFSCYNWLASRASFYRNYISRVREERENCQVIFPMLIGSLRRSLSMGKTTANSANSANLHKKSQVIF